MKTICVIPAYNAVATLPAVVKAVAKVVDEVIVVDDGSADESLTVARKSGALVARLPINRGQGSALRLGTKLALERGADIIVHFDADGQFLASDLPKLMAPLVSGQAQMVLGSRFLDETTKMPWTKKHILMPLARGFNRLLGIKLTDPQSGLRALSKVAAERLDWEHDRMAHCSEILQTAHRLGLVIKEVPITVLYHEYGQSWGGGVKIVKETLLAKLNQ